ncbi:MAG: type II toxin-antitoxin system MqsR family toxin [Thermodesulfobacteriota bacterium]
MAPPNKPYYDLGELKKLIGDEDTRIITQASLKDAATINFSLTEIIDTVQSLGSSDFYKTMPAEKRENSNQDVYKPIKKGIKLYVKLQKSSDDKCVVISFKKA